MLYIYIVIICIFAAPRSPAPPARPPGVAGRLFERICYMTIITQYHVLHDYVLVLLYYVLLHSIVYLLLLFERICYVNIINLTIIISMV